MRPEHKNAGTDLIPTRKSLLKRLRNWEDNCGWQDFFDTYWRLIYGFAIRRGLTHEEAEEAVQETVVAVAKSIARFEYDPKVCAFKTWLLGVTRSKIANQFARRARYPAAGDRCSYDGAEAGAVLVGVDPFADDWAEVWDREWQENLMESAIRRVKDRVSIEQYQMFDLFVVKEWPARDVARALGVSTANVYVAKHRISKLIRKEVEVLKAEPLRHEASA